MPTSLMETLKTSLDGCRRLALLGVGSELRGDDAAGLIVIRELDRLVSEGPAFRVLAYEGHEGSSAPENMTGAISFFKPTHILVVDAADIGLAVGECRKVELCDISNTSFSTHSLPLKVIMDYLERATGASLVVLGMQPASLGFDTPLTNGMKTGVEKLSKALYTVMRETDQKL